MALRARSLSVRAHAQQPKAVKAAGAAARKAVLGAGAALPLLAAAPIALAADADAVDTTVSTVTELVKATGSAVRSGIELAGAGVKVLKEGYEVASPYIQQGVEAVAPAVQEAVKVTSEVAGPVVGKAVPIVQDTLTGAIKSSGVDLGAVAKTTAEVAKTAAEGANTATPYVTKAWEFLTTTEPTLLAEYGLGALAAYLLAPALFGGLLGGLRGYAGELTAVQALEAINGDGNAVIIDIRTEREKESSGVPDVPGGASRLIDVEYATIEDRKLRGSLRDAGYIEAQVTALQIAALKRIGKGTKVLLLDRNGSTAKTVAKELGRRGFGRVYVIDGGFDGRGGWAASKLLVKPAAAGAASGGGQGSAVLSGIARTISSRRALPSPAK